MFSTSTFLWSAFDSSAALCSCTVVFSFFSLLRLLLLVPPRSFATTWRRSKRDLPHILLSTAKILFWHRKRLIIMWKFVFCDHVHMSTIKIIAVRDQEKGKKTLLLNQRIPCPNAIMIKQPRDVLGNRNRTVRCDQSCNTDGTWQARPISLLRILRFPH